MRTVLIPCASPAWDAEREDAKRIDAELNRKGMQRDRDHHLCAVQRSQQMRGYMMATLFRNAYGWCVRDTMNDGLGNMSGNGSREFAVEWAKKFHAEAPDRRVVLDDIDGIERDADEELARVARADENGLAGVGPL